MAYQKTDISLHMTAELAAAVTSLAATSFAIGFEVGSGSFSHVNLRTVNDVLVYLIHRGIKDTLVSIDNQIDQTEEKLTAMEHLLAFFMDHPTAKSAQSSDFPVGSPVAHLIDRLARLKTDKPASLEIMPSEVKSQFVTMKESLERIRTARVALQHAHAPAYFP